MNMNRWCHNDNDQGDGDDDDDDDILKKYWVSKGSLAMYIWWMAGGINGSI